MMTNFERNHRTLLACFVVAIFALIPLRFVEVNNFHKQAAYEEQVLGAMTQREVVVPAVNTTKRCIGDEEVSRILRAIEENLNTKDLTDERVSEMLLRVKEIQSARCN